jgi:alcohol dehydrogenase (cytochrome c)
LGATALGQAASGPFTQAQATAGRQAFEDNCAACHLQDLSGTNDAPALAGTPFMGAWGKRTTVQLYSKISTTMPLGQGGSLSQKQYTDIVAYILTRNGARAGNAAFTPTTSVQIDSIANGRAPAGAGAGRRTAGIPRRRPATAGKARGKRPAPWRANGSRSRRLRPADQVRTELKAISRTMFRSPAMMVNPPDGDWLMFRRNYQGWSYSLLKQITGQKSARCSSNGCGRCRKRHDGNNPIVHNGVMFVWGTGNTVQALNAATGELLWENRLVRRQPARSWSSTEETRSLGLWGNNVYVNTLTVTLR